MGSVIITIAQFHYCKDNGMTICRTAKGLADPFPAALRVISSPITMSGLQFEVGNSSSAVIIFLGKYVPEPCEGRTD